MAAKVLECFEKYYDMFLKTEDLSMLQDEYNKLLVHTDRRSRLSEVPKKRYSYQEASIIVENYW